jgi:lipopolysaccharide export system permease protein
MRLLARYLLRECLSAFFYCFSGFLIIWIAIDMSQELRDMEDNKMRFWDGVFYYLYKILPDFLPYALPMALLLAMLYALTNHARHNEITAMRAAGISLARIATPYFLIGFAAATVLFISNEFYAPQASEKAEEVFTKRVKQRRSVEERNQVKGLTFHNARENRFWRIGVYNQATGEMSNTKVVWHLPDGTFRSLTADRAVRTNGVWTFYHVRELRQLTGSNSTLVPLPQTNSLPVPEFSETLEEIKSEINVSSKLEHPTRTYRADIPLTEILDYLRLHPAPERAIRSKVYTKMNGRVAGPFACVVVVLLAVPFAAASGRRNVFVGVASSIFIFFAFFILQQIGFAVGEAGRVPAWIGAWFPILAFGGAGLWMMARVR